MANLPKAELLFLRQREYVYNIVVYPAKFAAWNGIFLLRISTVLQKISGKQPGVKLFLLFMDKWVQAKRLSFMPCVM